MTDFAHRAAAAIEQARRHQKLVAETLPGGESRGRAVPVRRRHSRRHA